MEATLVSSPDPETIKLRRYSAGVTPASLAGASTKVSYSLWVKRVRATLVRATNVAQK